VLHIPMMCSLGSWLLLRAAVAGMPLAEAAGLAAFVTIAITAGLAWPLAGLDQWWVRRVGRVTAWVLG
jgi:hypothetical protein